MLKVTTGGMDVFETTTFVAVSNSETKIVVSEEIETITFILEFAIDTNVKEQKTNLVVESVDVMRIKMTNWTSPLTTSLLVPTLVGTFGGREILIMVNAARIGDLGQLYRVTFTVYLGNEVRDGEA